MTRSIDRYGMTHYSTFTTPRSPLRRMSPKRLDSLDTWEQTKRIVRERDKTCQGIHKLTDVACRWPLDVHHLLPRGRGGRDEPQNCVLLCRAHHDAVHSAPECGEEVGLLRASWDARRDGAG